MSTQENEGRRSNRLVLKVNLGITNISILVELELFILHALCHPPPKVLLAACLLVLVEVVHLLNFEP